MTGTSTPSTAVRCSVSADVAELTELLRSFGELVPRPVELIELLSRFPRGAAAVDLDLLTAVRAGNDRIAIELSQRGFKLLAALRAIEVPSDLVGNFGHRSVSVGSVSRSSEGRSLGESQVSSGDNAHNAQGRVN